MLGNYQIAPAPTKQAAGEYKNMYQSMAGYRNQIMNIRNQLDGSSYGDVKSALAVMADNVNSQVEALKDLEHILYDIVSYYENAEKTILGEKKSILEKVKDGFADDFFDSIDSDLLERFLESSGEFIVQIGGIINEVTAVAASSGENAFIVVNPSVAQATSKIMKAGNWISTGAKYGFPIVGTVLDFVGQLQDGEDVLDAGIKAGVHLAIGQATGAIVGATIGSVVGSVIPGAGTAAGAVIGAVVGTVVEMVATTFYTVVGSKAFDAVYDEYLSEGVHKIWDNITDKAGEALDNIGDAFCGTAGNLGTIFG